MYYQTGERLSRAQQGDIEVISEEEWSARSSSFRLGREPLFCRFEQHHDGLFGTISVPPRAGNGSRVGFRCIVTNEKVTFVDDSGFVKAFLDKLCDRRQFREPSPARTLSAFFDELTQDDFEQMFALEKRIATLEDGVLRGEIAGFSEQMNPVRRELLTLHGYYTQLAECAQKLADDSVREFITKKEGQSFLTLYERTKRLADHTQIMREYSLQVSEVYQSQVDLRLNKTMKTLTVVTSVFLPLTLVTGWYGMNFKNMPELTWRFGYLFVALLAAAVAVGSILYIKRNRFDR